MKYISVCSGIEACTVAWHQLGWEALAYSDIEKFPRDLLKQKYPDVPLHGDFTKLRDESFIKDADLLVGGTPCQAFSVAGLRNSLDDSRGNLTLEFVRLANAIDDLRCASGSEATTILWENVPGILSTEDNAFGCFLAGLCGSSSPIIPPSNGWSYAGVVSGERRTAAWRVLDAQYFGVAQRRRRIFVLATGGSRRWRCADALLPITKGVSWNPRPSRKKGKETSPTITASSPFSSTGGSNVDTEVDAYQVVETTGHQGDRVYDTEDAFGTLPAQGGNNGGGCGGLIAGTLTSRDWKGVGFDSTDDKLVVTETYRLGGFGEYKPTDVGGTQQESGGPLSGGSESLVTHNKEVINALDTECGGGKLNQQTIESHTIFAVQNNQTRKGSCNGKGYNEDVMYTLDSQQPHNIASMAFNHDAGKFDVAADKDVCPTLRGKSSQGTGVSDVKNLGIRRLTPLECERLQGFPDNYTKIKINGKTVGDAPRYKALGNSMAVPVMRYIGERIQKVMCDEEK